jgi:outer membrane protein
MKRYADLTKLKSAVLFLAAIMAPAGWGQDASSIPSAPSPQTPVSSKSQAFDVEEYAKPKLHFPNLLSPYAPRQVPPPNLSNTPRIDQLMDNGKLYISIDDAVALVLENNLDIAIARYNMNIADTDIWRAKAGSTISGVNTGIVQNTPGGTQGGLGGHVGSGQGGTSVAAGGAGAGAGGLVGSTLGGGPQPTSFDAILTGTLLLDHLNSQCNTPFCATNQNTGAANFTYSQGFHWGTDMAIGFNNTRITSNSVYDFRTPLLGSSFQFKLTQHLLQGFGFAVNTRYIKIARNNREISDVAFRYQVIATVNQIENIYWDLVYAYENVKVQREQLGLAQMTLSNNQKQVQIGSLVPIEVVRAQSTIAADEQSLAVALTNLELQQLLIKNAMTRSLGDPLLIEAEVIPTSTMELPAQEAVVPTQDLINEAFNHRPELALARINLTNVDISRRAIRNALLPSLDLSAYYAGSGQGGSPNGDYICAVTPQVCGLKIPPAQLPVVSYGATLQQLVDSTAPDKGVQLSLSIPIRNRAAQATQVRSEFEYRQSQLQLQQLENQIRIEVRNAQFGVQQTRASVASAKLAVELARQALDYEQKKFEIRASTAILVLQSQLALTQAEATLISAKAAYVKADLELDRATGLLLEHAGILFADAERGEVTHKLSVPHVGARPADLQPSANQPVQRQN